MTRLNTSTLRMGWLGLVAVAMGIVVGCSVMEPLSDISVVVSIFDPSAGDVPMPNDIFVDDANGAIAIPADVADDPSFTAAEVALLESFDGRRGWPSYMSATLDFSGALAPESISPGTIRVFAVDEDALEPVAAIMAGEPTVAPDRIRIQPPEGGWMRGRTYWVAALAGEDGLRGLNNEAVVPDAAFALLQQTTPLVGSESTNLGDGEAAAFGTLEALRLELAPMFEKLARVGLPRERIVNLWSFTATSSPEVVMDPVAGGMPLPSDFLRNPSSHRVELPIGDGDTAFLRDIKETLNRYDGFGLSSSLTFQLTTPIDAATATAESIMLYAFTGGELSSIPVEITVQAGGQRITLDILGEPLQPATDHLVVLSKELKDPAGNWVEPMLAGTLAMLPTPLLDDGNSTISMIDSELAARFEFVREVTHPATASLMMDRQSSASDVAVAWSFRTLSIQPAIVAKRDAAQSLGISPDPIDVSEQSVLESILDFPIGAISMFNVDKVFRGKIMMPEFLDPITRRDWRDGSWQEMPVDFTMTIPKNLAPGEPLKVVIFAHAIVTERRFVYAIADALARKGLAAIAIDLPYHGERTHCRYEGPLCIVNPLDPDGDLVCLNPCERGTTCNDEGRCVDEDGNGNHLGRFPLLPMYRASGSAFLDLSNLPGIRDNIFQAVADLSTLLRSLRQGNWRDAIGYTIDPDVGFVGQSLGAIVGTLFTAAEPSITRAVLNVPGGGLLDLFRKSIWFEPHFEHLLRELEVEPGTDEHARLMSLARWVADPVDPHTYAPYLLTDPLGLISTSDSQPVDRKVMFQMAALDFIIPNEQTTRLADRAQAPRYDYFAEHAFLCVPIEPGFYAGVRDMATLVGENAYP